MTNQDGAAVSETVWRKELADYPGHAYLDVINEPDGEMQWLMPTWVVDNIIADHEASSKVKLLPVLRAALERYGSHSAHCTARNNLVYPPPCSCGFAIALADAEVG